VLGKAIPYGVYDVSKNAGWVSVGKDHDTAAFAVETIRRWWLGIGMQMYPASARLMICADGGGSNGSRARLWKTELARLADDHNVEVTVCDPPGTSKWNKSPWPCRPPGRMKCWPRPQGRGRRLDTGARS